jgi:nicotinate-nucleotide--dimethylbenzimidazole phosphoribosyltransferase
VQLAEEYRRLGRLDEAIEVLEKGLEKSPGYVSAQVALGRCRLEAGETDAAVEVLEEVLSQDATQLVANKLLVEGYLQQGRRQDARRRLDLYRQLTGEDPEIEALEQRLEETKSGLPPAPPFATVSEEPEIGEAEPPPGLTAEGVEPAAREGVVDDETPASSLSSDEEPLFSGLSESAPPAQPSPESDPDDTLFDLSGGGDFSRHAEQLSQEGLFSFHSSPAAATPATEPASSEPELPQPDTPTLQTAESRPGASPAPEALTEEPFADLMPAAPAEAESEQHAEETTPTSGDDLFELGPPSPATPPASEAIFDLSPPQPTATESPETEEPFADLAAGVAKTTESAGRVEEPEPFAVPPVEEAEPLDSEIPTVEELAAAAPARSATEEPAWEEPAPEMEAAESPEAPLPVAEESFPVEEEAAEAGEELEIPEAAAELELPAPIPIEDQPAPEELPDLAAEAEAAARELQAEAAASLSTETADEEEDGGLTGDEPVSATLGQLYLQQGHGEEAEKIFRRVLEREPAHPVALAGLETLAKSREPEVEAPKQPSAEESPLAEEPFEVSATEAPVIEDLAAQAAADEEGSEELAADADDSDQDADLAAEPAVLRASDLLQGSEADAASGLTARKVVLLKNYLQRLRAGA